MNHMELQEGDITRLNATLHRNGGFGAHVPGGTKTFHSESGLKPMDEMRSRIADVQIRRTQRKKSTIFGSKSV